MNLTRIDILKAGFKIDAAVLLLYRMGFSDGKHSNVMGIADTNN